MRSRGRKKSVHTHYTQTHFVNPFFRTFNGIWCIGCIFPLCCSLNSISFSVVVRAYTLFRINSTWNYWDGDVEPGKIPNVYVCVMLAQEIQRIFNLSALEFKFSVCVCRQIQLFFMSWCVVSSVSSSSLSAFGFEWSAYSRNVSKYLYFTENVWF